MCMYKNQPGISQKIAKASDSVDNYVNHQMVKDEYLKCTISKSGLSDHSFTTAIPKCAINTIMHH